jgi:hypothetical protein
LAQRQRSANVLTGLSEASQPALTMPGINRILLTHVLKHFSF